jgi:hypothetical protein
VRFAAVRSPEEIRFRLGQELGNLFLFAGGAAFRRAHPAVAKKTPWPFADPVRAAEALRARSYAAEVESIAAGILAHRFPLFGLVVETGPAIDWRRDYVHGVSTGTPYFRRSPYLNFARSGDHKIIWELNRHQHFPLLAQAFLLTNRREFLDEAFRQLESWMEENPFLRGINWASALEVAFRALSWVWLYQLAAGEIPERLRGRWLAELYRHGRYLELNLSIYFSPNTHLLGEAVALHALGVLFPGWARAARWSETGGRIVQEQLQRQVRPDGSHFEQSAYYHVYALDFFLLHYVLAGRPKEHAGPLMRMAGYLHALMGPAGELPLIGDDDGGRLFHPYGDRMQFGRGTLATCAALFHRPEWMRSTEDLACQAAWWLRETIESPASESPASETGRPNRLPDHSELFADAGVAVMISGDVHLVIKAGPFGEGSGGHSHSDVLSVVARLRDREILIDPGTYTYVADPAERNGFRGSAAHNTVRIDSQKPNGRDQAIPAGPFRWIDKPATTIRQWNSTPDRDYLDAACAYAGFTHRRRVLFLKPAVLVVLDTVDGPPGEHWLEQFWHLAELDDASRFCFSEPAEVTEGWRSRVFASKESAPVLRVTRLGLLPAWLAAVIDFSESPTKAPVEWRREGETISVAWRGVRVQFSNDGEPLIG